MNIVVDGFRVFAVALLLLHGIAFAHDPKRFDDVKHWKKTFDDPARDQWQKPDDVIRWLAINPNETWADIGAGTGYFSVRLAKSTPQGKVYAADVERNMVAHLKARMKKERLVNVQVVQSSADSAKLPVWVDSVLVVNTYHHIPDPSKYFSKLKPNVRKRLVVIDFTPTSPIGPPAKHRVSQPMLIDTLRQAGWTLNRTFDELPNQYCLEFVP